MKNVFHLICLWSSSESIEWMKEYLKEYGEEAKETILRTAMNAEDNIGRIPLHYAAAKGNLRLVKEILDYTNNIGRMSLDSDTPEMKAREFGHFEAAKYLMDYATKKPFLHDKKH